MSIRHPRLVVFAVLATSLALLTPSVPLAASAANPSRAFLKALEKGEALMAQGRHQEAIRTLRKAEKLSTVPSWQVLQNLAVCFNRVGQPERSEDYARAAVEVAETPSQKASALFMLGLSFDLSVEAEEAEAAFREVLELTDGQANIARYRLGQVLQRQGRHQDAYAAFSEYVERQPDGELSAEARSAMDTSACWLEQSDSGRDLPRRCRSPIGASTWCRDGLTVDIVPPTKIFSPNPQYTPAARMAGVQGVVVIEAIIDRSGAVRCTNILKDLPMGMGQAAADTVSRWKFEPATLHGEPVASIYNLSLSFRRK